MSYLRLHLQQFLDLQARHRHPNPGLDLLRSLDPPRHVASRLGYGAVATVAPLHHRLRHDVPFVEAGQHVDGQHALASLSADEPSPRELVFAAQEFAVQLAAALAWA